MADPKKKKMPGLQSAMKKGQVKTGKGAMLPLSMETRARDQKEKAYTYLFLGFILILTYFLFSNGLHNKFLDWDDSGYLRDNPDIRALSISNLKAMFSLDKSYVGNWQPLTILSYAIEYSLVKLDSPFLYHLDNLLLHLLNVVLVFWLIRKISRKRRVALLAALFFAIHPLRVESVSWIAERKDVLYAFFFLLSSIVYTYYLREGLGVEMENTGNNTVKTGKALKYYLLMAVLFICSALSKSAAVVLPLVLLLFDFLYRRKISLLLFLEKIPLLLISLFIGFMAFRSQGEAVKDMPAFSLFERILIVNHSFLRYLFMTVFPLKLSALHPYPYKPGNAMPIFYYLAPIITLSIVAALIYSLKYTRRLMFGFLFFLVSITLVLQLVPVGGAVVSERYTYIPHVALFFMVAYYLVKLWDSKTASRPLNRAAVLVLIFAATITWSVITYNRNDVWKSDISLWDDAIAKDGDINSTAYFNRGKARQDCQDRDGAIEDYNKAIFLRPNYDRAIINRGLMKQDKGDLQGALADYNRAVEVNPDYYIVYNNRGAVKKILGDIKGAHDDFEKSVKLQPNVLESLYNLGTSDYLLKDYKGALEYFNRTLAINPGYVRTYNFRAAAKIFLGDQAGACKDWATGAGLGDQACKSNLEKNCK